MLRLCRPFSCVWLSGKCEVGFLPFSCYNSTGKKGAGRLEKPPGTPLDGKGKHRRMKQILWELECLSAPPVFRYCRKCKEKKPFLCSGRFRVNAQQKTLTVWLIYKCTGCDATWNAAICSRVSPQAFAPAQLEAFHTNAEDLVRRFAMDFDLLRKNGAETGLPAYTIIGADFSPDEAVVLTIQSKYAVPVKVSAVLREKLHLPQKEFSRRLADRRIRSIPEQDLRRCKLNNGITILFQPDV